MLHATIRELRPAAVMLAAVTLIAGVLYPAAVTGMAQALFPQKANGNMVERDGKTIGSTLIAQPFISPRYFWSRPSACGYNAAASSGSNLSMGNPALADAVKERAAALRASDPGNTEPIPVDLVLASGSGLDPHISPEAALWQVPRIARERKLDPARLKAMVDQATEPRTFGILGEPRVNVLRLNRALDSVK